MQLQLVTKPGTRQTGIGRYAAELEDGVRRAGIEVRRAELRSWVPTPAASLAARVGYDLAAFSRSYPLRVDARPGYVTLLTSQNLAILLRTQRLPKPTIVVVHDILPYLLRDDPNLTVYRHRFDRLVDGTAMGGLRRANHLITDSAYTKQTVVDALGVPAERITVVHLGVDAERFRPRPVSAEFRARYHLPDGSRLVLAVGTEDPRKNLAALLQAMAAVAREVPNVLLLKVGAPSFADQRERHRKLCQDLGIDRFVRWVDAVPEEDLPHFYNAADVLGFPSTYEGFGFPVLEALASGTPVVAARRASIPELVGDASLLVDEPTPDALAAAIVATLRARPPDPSPLVSQAARFTWQRTVDETLALCELVAMDTQGHPRRRGTG